MEEYNSKNKANRIAVLVSGDGSEKLLGFPQSGSGTEFDEVTAVYKTLVKWEGLKDRIRLICFDTTKSNTGQFKGACKCLEDMLEKRLYSSACRQHVRELTITAAHNTLFPISTGPDVELFKDFMNTWNADTSFDKKAWESGLTDPNLAPFLEELKEETVKFLKQQIKDFHPREDYLEFLELGLLLFGEKLEKVIF